MKKLILLFVILLLLLPLGIYSPLSNKVNLSIDTVTTSYVIEKPKPVNLSINFFGDLLMHGVVYQSAFANGTYDFTNQFIDIKDKVTDADFTVGNLEIPLAGEELGYSSYPSFNCPEELLTTLANTLDVELVTTATNHSLDKGYKGLVNTIDFLDKTTIDNIGTYKDESSSEEIYIKEIKDGVKVAFLNYTYGTNGIPIPEAYPYCVNLIDREKIKSDSEKAKELGAHYIIAAIHWGTEYTDENDEQKDLSKYIFENTDINLIVGNHPHVTQNIEQINVVKDGTPKVGTVIYSLGNFISAQFDQYTDTGIMTKVNLEVNKSDFNASKVTTIEYTPVFVDKNPSSPVKKYRVVDINKAISDYEGGLDNLISQAEYGKLLNYRNYYREKLLIPGFVTE